MSLSFIDVIKNNNYNKIYHVAVLTCIQFDWIEMDNIFTSTAIFYSVCGDVQICFPPRSFPLTFWWNYVKFCNIPRKKIDSVLIVQFRDSMIVEITGLYVWHYSVQTKQPGRELDEIKTDLDDGKEKLHGSLHAAMVVSFETDV